MKVTELETLRTEEFSNVMESPGLGVELQPSVFRRTDLAVRRMSA